MKTLIAIPCMDQLDVRFVESLSRLQPVGDTEIAFQPSSLIYHSRNNLALKAIEGKYDYVPLLWDGAGNDVFDDARRHHFAHPLFLAQIFVGVHP